jgi:hypothetical protein
MHGNALALSSITPIASINDPGYQLTVNVPSYPSGTSILGIAISTANEYTDHANIPASGVTSWTFNIPANQGWVRVCVDSDVSSDATCKTYDTTGADMSISLSPPSGDSNRYYVYPGNTYYIYPGIRHDYYFHHGGDHGYGGHDYDGGHWFGGHHDTGNIGEGGNQNSGNIGDGGHQDRNGGNIGDGGHQDHGVGGHQDGGSHGVGEPVHHTSNGKPMINAESSDDD